jgi:hypothetical protein
VSSRRVCGSNVELAEEEDGPVAAESDSLAVDFLFGVVDVGFSCLIGIIVGVVG